MENSNQDLTSDCLTQNRTPIEEPFLSILDNNDAINEEGCRFFVNAKNSNPTYISSYQLRWFTYEFGDDNKQKTQEGARIRIETEAKQSSRRTEDFDISILLYSDPTKWKEERIETKYIEYLLNCRGVIVKYLEPKDEQLLRMSICGSKLLLSESKAQENQVRKAFLYESKTENSLLMAIFNDKFEKDFKLGKRIKLDSNGNIVFADNCCARHKKWRKSDKGTTIIWSIISAIISAIITLLLK